MEKVRRVDSRILEFHHQQNDATKCESRHHEVDKTVFGRGVERRGDELSERGLTEKTAREEERVSSRKASIVRRRKGHHVKHRAHREKRREEQEPQSLERRAKRRRKARRREAREKKMPTLVLSKRPEDS